MTDTNIEELLAPRTPADRLADANGDTFRVLFADLRAAAAENGRTLSDLAASLGVDEARVLVAFDGTRMDLSQSDIEQLAIAAGARLFLRAFVPDASQPAALGAGDTTEALAAMSHVEELLWARFWEAHRRGDAEEEKRWFGALCRCDDVRIVLGD